MRNHVSYSLSPMTLKTIVSLLVTTATFGGHIFNVRHISKCNQTLVHHGGWLWWLHSLVSDLICH